MQDQLNFYENKCDLIKQFNGYINKNYSKNIYQANKSEAHT